MEIFDKLLTYVDKSSDLTQSMIDNYNNSMIVLGDQKQMYIPILNSYIGIGKDYFDETINNINQDLKLTTKNLALNSNGTIPTSSLGSVYGIVGDTTSGARIPTRWFVNLDNGDTELRDGMIISFRIPTDGLETVGECLTIDGDESHFHQIVYNTNDFLTTHFDVDSVITVQYDSTIVASMYGRYNSSTNKYVHNGNTQSPTLGVWRVLSLYDSGNTDVRYQQTINYPMRKVASDGAICRYTLCMMNKEGQITSLTLVNNTLNTSKTMYSGYLDPRKIYYWDHIDTYAANDNITQQNTLLTHNGDLIDYRFTFNCGSTLTPRSNFYIVGTIDANGFKLDPSQPWSCSLPNSEDGKVYIYVGMVYTDTSGYRGTLEEVNTIYYYKNGKIRTYSGFSDTSISSDYSTYSYTSYLSCYSYTGLFTTINSGFYPISFVTHDANLNRYFSYQYITADKQVGVPTGFTQSDIFDIHNIDFIRFKNFDCGLYWYEDENALFATYFRGMLLGVASYADSLYNPVKINGTNFDGSTNITTTYWGNTRIFNIADNTLVNYGPDVNVQGDKNITLKLPKKLVVDIDGKSTYSSTNDLSNRTYRQSIRLTNTNNSYYITFTDGFSNNIFSYSYINSHLKFNPHDEILYSTYFNGWLKGTADAAVKLLNSKNINGTAFDGTDDITTTYWGAKRNIILSDYYSTYTYTNTDIDGGTNFTLKLPDNIHANLNGNADTATFAQSTYLSNNTIRMFNNNTITNSSYFITFVNDVNTYSYSYINGNLLYNPGTEELESTYFHATSLFRGKVRAQDQWGILGSDAPIIPIETETETNIDTETETSTDAETETNIDTETDI